MTDLTRYAEPSTVVTIRPVRKESLFKSALEFEAYFIQFP
jgi:hypothetical protein